MQSKRVKSSINCVVYTKGDFHCRVILRASTGVNFNGLRALRLRQKKSSG